MGEGGEILIGWAQSVLQRQGEETIFATGFDRRTISSTLLENFLCERRCSEPTEDHGGQTLAWLEAAHRSLETQRWELT